MTAVSCSEYRYEKVAGDPLNTRIYTLDNGLKVYMTVNKETPRIQTFIAVKVGAKNDPAETTGLAHYFEHLMFKGTEQFGTQNYEAEKPLLDEIERLFEQYRNTEDPQERTAIYAEIDRVSNEASKLAIPNEYDKLMAAIGAEGTNAWTSYDETVYTEDIPSNQIENWARIEADRFANAVIRGFHTELETVYEEYNMSLTDDNGKAFETLSALLFPTHPCGQHTVLGTQEHLKNPSITNIKNYFRTYYVPNNIAICMSGDFDPEKTIKIIDKYFGSLAPNDNLPEFEFEPAVPLASPASAEIYGNETDFVFMGWRTDGARSEDAELCELVGNILYNKKCGLFDTDLVNAQKVLDCGAFSEQMPEVGALITAALPKEGQSLEELRDLMLAEIAKLRNGDFDEELLTSTIANAKRSFMRQSESNRGRAMRFVSSFINGTQWADEVAVLDRMSSITKEQIVEWANKYLRDDNYAIVYKRQGEDKNQKKIDKPHITPIATNRDAVSDFLAEVQQSQVEPVKPVFVDYDRDMSKGRLHNGLELLYKRNETNDLFTLTYLYQFDDSDPEMEFATEYFDMLGTDSKSLDEIWREFYDLACDFSLSTTSNRVYVTISGLGENMDKAIALAEEYLNNVQGDDEVLAELKNDLLKERSDNKLSQQANFAALRRYAVYGPEYVKAHVLTNEGIAALTSDRLVAKIKSLAGLKHRVLYYGPLTQSAIVKKLNAEHHTAETLTDPCVERKPAIPQQVNQNKVVLAQYDAKQIYYTQYSKNESDNFSTDNDALIEMYNGYFGGGMNGIVFQEMREARGLAYTARAYYAENLYPEQGYEFQAFIATQNDKMQQAIEAFDEIIENMPQSQAAFEIAKQSALASIETARTTKASVLWSYINNEDKGIEGDRNKAVYEQIKTMTLDDVVKFQQERIKGRKYLYLILGDKRELDMNYLRSLGDVTFVSQEEIFGY
ncbi:MAG: insulinase family protein [Alistipes sp.]|nr:insulinase family protein [Alistipes sp.]